LTVTHSYLFKLSAVILVSAFVAGKCVGSTCGKYITNDEAEGQ